MVKKQISSSVFSTFDPREYLQEYYSKIGSENQGLLEFFIHAYDDIKPNSIMLEFGGGPTVYPLITAATKVKEIHFSDYLDSNLNEVRCWKSASPGAFDWTNFFKKALFLEGKKNLSKKEVQKREKLVRQKIAKFMHCDAFKRYPINPKLKDYYDVINTNFVTESITSSIKDWENIFANVCSMLKEGGWLIMTALKEAQYYRIGDKMFPAVNINEEDFIRVLTKLGFQETNFILSSIPAEITNEDLQGYVGYKGMIFLKAKK